jgi:hypothetical protein
MTGPVPPPVDELDPVGPLVTRLLGCLCDQLPATLAGPACFCCARPGLAVPADFCCSCDGVTPGEGQAWVRAARIFPVTARFPTPQADRDPCERGGWAVELQLGVWRCAATVDDEGNPPECADVTRDAMVALSDAAAMRRAVKCCFAVPRGDYLVVVNGWEPLGPNGGCAGGQLTITVGFYDCACPEPLP